MRTEFSFSRPLTVAVTNNLTYSDTMTPFDAPGKQAISPFPTVFSTHLDSFLPFLSNLKLLSTNSFSLEESKICRLVMA